MICLGTVLRLALIIVYLRYWLLFAWLLETAVKLEFNSWDKRLRVPIFNDMRVLCGKWGWMSKRSFT